MRYLKVKYQHLLAGCPSIHHTGSIKGMKNKYWGKNAEVVRCGSYYYNISNLPIAKKREIYYLSRR